MSITQKFLAGFGLAALLLVSSSAISADIWDKTTRLTFNEPTRIPGAVLEPGSYVFKLAELMAERNVVMVFNEDQTRLLATIFAIPDSRPEISERTVLEFSDSPDGIRTLRSWFFPGDLRGFEFRYPKAEADSIARAHQSAAAVQQAEVSSRPGR